MIFLCVFRTLFVEGLPKNIEEVEAKVKLIQYFQERFGVTVQVKFVRKAALVTSIDKEREKTRKNRMRLEL